MATVHVSSQPRRRPKRLRAKPKPPLRTSEILAWADAFFERHGRWPRRDSGPIKEASGETWHAVNQALHAGCRGLTPGSSLARLLNEHRGVRNRKALRPYAVDEILAWADAHWLRSGCWPRSDSGPVAEAPGETWQAVNQALRAGIRGLPGGSSLARLLSERRGVRNGRVPPPYSLKQILAWAKSHCERTGIWPTHQSGPIAEAPGETWLAVDRALRSGGRGLRGRTSLPKLLYRRCRVKISHRRAAPLRIEDVLAWADAHHRRTRQWPNQDSGAIPEAPGETWCKVQNALRQGRRGFRKDSSLSLLLAEHRGARNHLNLPPFSVRQILAWSDAYYARHGGWPHRDSGPIEEAPGETWTAVEVALAHGKRGLKGGSSLAQLLAEHREVRNRGKLPELSIAIVLSWADAHQARTGTWPRVTSGAIPEAPGETWLAVDKAARDGRRGLPSRSSLAKLLLKHRCVKPKHRRQPPLDVEMILVWADDHRRRTGRWPNQTAGPIPQAPGETWGKIDVALREGKRSLAAGQTIGKLLAKYRGVRNLHSIKPLTVKQILAWADEHFARHGRWPGCRSGPTDGEPGENWLSVENALRHGLRGLKGGSSLARLLARHRRAKHARAT